MLTYQVSRVFIIISGFAVWTKGDVGIYNSSEACLIGSGRNIALECNSETTLGVLVVRRLLHGLTPTSMGCSGFTSPANSCCPGYDESRDCLFATDDGLADLRSTCDGSSGCDLQFDRVKVENACPSKDGGSLEYSGDYSFFAFVEYTCIGTDRLVDVCASTLNTAANELYLETNVYHKNTEHENKTCACRISTACGHRLIFHTYDLALASDGQGQCTETVVLSDYTDSSVSTNLSCSDSGAGLEARNVGPGQEEGSVFVSKSNVVDFKLQLLSKNTGKTLIRVTASGGVPLEVRCGEAGADYDPLQTNQDCAAITTESQTASAAAAATTTMTTSTTTAAIHLSTTAVPTTTDRPGSTEAYNTSEICLMGADRNSTLEIDCSKTPMHGHIFIRRALHGVTPDHWNCGITSPASVCCPKNDMSRVCVFSSEEGLEKVKERCDGYASCALSLERATVSFHCPATYDGFSSFALVEYTCINPGLMTDVCAIGNTKRDTEIYLETNVYNQNKEHANKTCTCAVSTQCGHKVIFHAYDLDLYKDDQGQCFETVVLSDGSDRNISTSLNCSNNGEGEMYRTVEVGEGEGSVFVSESNVARLEFVLAGANLGSMLFRVTATGGAMVEVRCGSTAELDVWEEHRCPPTPTADSEPRQAMTTTSSGNAVFGNNGETNRLDSTVIAGIIVAAVIVCLITIVLALLFWRSRRKSDEEPVTEPDPVQQDTEFPQTQPPHIYDCVLYPNMEPYDRPAFPVPNGVNGDVEKEPRYVPLHAPARHRPAQSSTYLTPSNGAAAVYHRDHYARVVLNTDDELQGAVGGAFSNPTYVHENGLNDIVEKDENSIKW